MKKPTKKDLEKALMRIARMRGATGFEPWGNGFQVTVNPSLIAAYALSGKEYQPKPWGWVEF